MVQSTFALNDSGRRYAFFLLIISICCPCSVIVLLNHRHMDDQANDRHTLSSYDPRAVLAQYVDFATLQAFIHFKQNPNCFDLHADLFCVCLFASMLSIFRQEYQGLLHSDQMNYFLSHTHSHHINPDCLKVAHVEIKNIADFC